MVDVISFPQSENWLYEIRQKGQKDPCYVMVPNVKVCSFI